MHIKKALFVLRLLGYMGVQFNALIVPLIVYNLSNSIVMAGFVLAVEWVPKLFAYVFGGGIITRLSFKKSHFYLEALRLIAFITFFGCVYANLFNVILIGLGAALYQVSNALSNIIFERSVTNNWGHEQKSQGHASLLLADQIACFVVLGIGLMNLSINALIILAIMAQLITIIGLKGFGSLLYSKSPNESSLNSPSLKEALISVIKTRQLRLIAFFGIILGVPVAYVYSGIVFFIPLDSANSNRITQILSMILLIKTGTSIIILKLLNKYVLNRSDLFSKKLAIFGVILLAISCFGLYFFKSNFLVGIVFIILIGCAPLFFTPFLRTARQQTIQANISTELQDSATGLLISVEALAYLVAAYLLTLNK